MLNARSYRVKQVIQILTSRIAVALAVAGEKSKVSGESLLFDIAGISNEEKVRNI